MSCLPWVDYGSAGSCRGAGPRARLGKRQDPDDYMIAAASRLYTYGPCCRSAWRRRATLPGRLLFRQMEKRRFCCRPSCLLSLAIDIIAIVTARPNRRAIAQSRWNSYGPPKSHTLVRAIMAKSEEKMPPIAGIWVNAPATRPPASASDALPTAKLMAFISEESETQARR